MTGKTLTQQLSDITAGRNLALNNFRDVARAYLAVPTQENRERLREAHRILQTRMWEWAQLAKAHADAVENAFDAYAYDFDTLDVRGLIDFKLHEV